MPYIHLLRKLVSFFKKMWSSFNRIGSHHNLATIIGGNNDNKHSIVNRNKPIICFVIRTDCCSLWFIYDLITRSSTRFFVHVQSFRCLPISQILSHLEANTYARIPIIIFFVYAMLYQLFALTMTPIIIQFLF